MKSVAFRCNTAKVSLNGIRRWVTTYIEHCSKFIMDVTGLQQLWQCCHKYLLYCSTNVGPPHLTFPGIYRHKFGILPKLWHQFKKIKMIKKNKNKLRVVIVWVLTVTACGHISVHQILSQIFLKIKIARHISYFKTHLGGVWQLDKILSHVTLSRSVCEENKIRFCALIWHLQFQLHLLVQSQSMQLIAYSYHTK